MKKTILQIIRIYQQTLSPDHGWASLVSGYQRCRFFPTCSEYTHRAISKHGIKRGLELSLKRIGRCFGAAGGYDPVK